MGGFLFYLYPKNQINNDVLRLSYKVNLSNPVLAELTLPYMG